MPQHFVCLLEIQWQTISGAIEYANISLFNSRYNIGSTLSNGGRIYNAQRCQSSHTERAESEASHVCVVVFFLYFYFVLSQQARIRCVVH